MVGKACGTQGFIQALIVNHYNKCWFSRYNRTNDSDELKDLACLGFSADLVMQSLSYCSISKTSGLATHNTFPDFIHNRGGISFDREMVLFIVG